MASRKSELRRFDHQFYDYLWDQDNNINSDISNDNDRNIIKTDEISDMSDADILYNGKNVFILHLPLISL